MDKLTTLDDFKNAQTDILAKYETYVKRNLDKSDFKVRNQHCLLYKWWCRKWWNHCFAGNTDKGECLRCGAINL